MKNICFISSTGGHLTQLQNIFREFTDNKFYIITEKNKTTEHLNKKYLTSYLFQQDRKSFYFFCTLIINFILSIFFFLKIRPKYIITTGAGVVIPFCIIGKLFGAKLIFIESFAKVNTPTITGRILYRFSDKFYVQWEELLSYYKDAEFKGRLY